MSFAVDLFLNSVRIQTHNKTIVYSIHALSIVGKQRFLSSFSLTKKKLNKIFSFLWFNEEIFLALLAYIIHLKIPSKMIRTVLLNALVCLRLIYHFIFHIHNQRSICIVLESSAPRDCGSLYINTFSFAIIKFEF